jgi:hypothetical protein
LKPKSGEKETICTTFRSDHRNFIDPPIRIYSRRIVAKEAREADLIDSPAASAVTTSVDP